MELGELQRVYTIEPLEDPVPRAEPEESEQQPSRAPSRKEPVRDPAPQQ
jgi:hypothetical protein